LAALYPFGPLASIEVARPLGIAVHDHIIVGKGRRFSAVNRLKTSRRGKLTNARAPLSKRCAQVVVQPAPHPLVQRSCPGSS
jgi:hypothetical protein